jgi:hypothetical protein
MAVEAAQDEDGAVHGGGRTNSAAAPCVAFPAELLAAARGFGIMTDYLRAGFGEQGRAGEGGRPEGDKEEGQGAKHGRGRQKCTDAADRRMDSRMRQTTEPLSRLSGKEEVTEPGGTHTER